MSVIPGCPSRGAAGLVKLCCESRTYLELMAPHETSTTDAEHAKRNLLNTQLFDTGLTARHATPLLQRSNITDRQ